MNKLKLPRVNKSMGYTTGEAQTWTYQYTWEDWQAVKDDPSSDWYTVYAALYLFLLDYFTEHPEYVQDHKEFKGYTLDQIRFYMQRFKNDPFYTEEHVLALRRLWDDMVSCANKISVEDGNTNSKRGHLS